MTVEVVTVWAPRPTHEKWRNDYLTLLRLQKQTVEKFGHQHLVVTDADLGVEFNTLKTDLPESLMKAMIAGIIARLRAPKYCNLVFVDVDCLVNRELQEAFTGCQWELGLTRRDNELAPINNGAMYVRLGAQQLAAQFFDTALSLCGDHWGADQEAISQAAAPVPVTSGGVELRGNVRVGFLSMKTHNAVPKAAAVFHRSKPFILHFKGETKEWAAEYAKRYLLT